MDSYIDIKINPNAEMRENVLLNKVFTKLHKAIFDLKANDIGISFPQAKKRLGKIIRVHSSFNKLEDLQSANWLRELSGYCQVSSIDSVPEKVKGYVTISRLRQNMTDSKLRRLVKRGSISDDAINQYKSKMFASGLNEPYLELESTSTHSKYRLYIAFGKLQDREVGGEFNRFGLSPSATVPIF